MSDDKIAEIRARHLRDELWRNGPSMISPQSHADRAFLLDLAERQRAEIERLRETNKQLVSGIDTITRSKNEDIERLRAENGRMHGAFKNLALKLRIALEGKP